MSYVYVLESIKSEKRYVGSTRLRPEERLKKHNSGSCRWTKGHRPLKLVYFEQFSTYQEAVKREKFLKSGVGRKELEDLLFQILERDPQ